jgi:branched-chain amino acid transport system substrate-binding protein
MRSRLHAAIGVLAGLAATPAVAAELNVGAIFALTGSASFIGVAERDGALLALDEANAKGINGHTIKFQVNDDGSDRNQVAALMGRLTSDASILAIYGPTTGATAPPAAAVANDKKVPMIATSNGPTVLSAGPWSFIT